MTVTPARRFRQVLETLVEHRVRFVLIGGLAGRARGSPELTNDVDVCYDRRADNLDALAGALQEMNAVLRGAPPGLPFRLDAQTLLAGDSFTFLTDHGAVDILGTPSGTSGYDGLKRNAELMDFGYGLTVWVCDLEDLLRMKRAAGRTRDRVSIEVLGALRDQLEDRPEDDVRSPRFFDPDR